MADMKAALEADDIAKSETEYPIESKAKGQLISKCLFGVFNSHKKRMKTIQLEVM